MHLVENVFTEDTIFKSSVFDISYLVIDYISLTQLFCLNLILVQRSKLKDNVYPMRNLLPWTWIIKILIRVFPITGFNHLYKEYKNIDKKWGKGQYHLSFLFQCVWLFQNNMKIFSLVTKNLTEKFFLSDFIDESVLTTVN